MEYIHVCHHDDVPWVTANPRSEEAAAKGASRRRHPGGSEQPQLLEVRVFPNEKIAVHAHETGEILYIVRGEMHFGRHVLKPGDSIFIPSIVLYSFSGGPDGVDFLNFRPRKDLTHFSREDVRALSSMLPHERTTFIEENIRQAMSHYNIVD